MREESEWWRGRGCAKKANRGGVAVARMRGIKRTVTGRVGQWWGCGCTKKTNVGGGERCGIASKRRQGRGCAKTATGVGGADARYQANGSGARWTVAERGCAKKANGGWGEGGIAS